VSKKSIVLEMSNLREITTKKQKFPLLEILTDKRTILLKKGSSEGYQCNSLQIGETVLIKEQLSRKEKTLILTECNTLKDLEIRTIKRGLQRFTRNTLRILMLLHSK
jgi:hypothetical protein